MYGEPEPYLSLGKHKDLSQGVQVLAKKAEKPSQNYSASCTNTENAEKQRRNSWRSVPQGDCLVEGFEGHKSELGKGRVEESDKNINGGKEAQKNRNV